MCNKEGQSPTDRCSISFGFSLIADDPTVVGFSVTLVWQLVPTEAPGADQGHCHAGLASWCEIGGKLPGSLWVTEMEGNFRAIP